MVGLCKAAKTWDEEKSAFSTYASRVILNEIKMEFRRRSKRPPTTSLNYEMENGEGGRDEVLNLIVGEADVDYFDFKIFYDRLSPMDKEILFAR
jgi:DNA-directed RNA polymerase specialized sigma24 family protein